LALLVASGLCIVTGAAQAQNYVGTVLYPIQEPSGMNTTIVSSSAPGATGGYGILNSPQNIHHALFWTAGGVVDLNPTSFGNVIGQIQSQVSGVGGSQQVGYGSGIDTASLYREHALLWNGTAGSVIDLNPTNLSGFAFSYAVGTDRSQQVGYGKDSSGAANYHALLWNGTADSAVDLNPTGLNTIKYTRALATDGVQQVGDGRADGSDFQAILWTGTAASAVNLNPTQIPGVLYSSALGVGGGEQVGSAYGTVGSQAIVWHETAASAIDLNPTQLGFTACWAYGTNGVVQVGYGNNPAFNTGPFINGHALAWMGTANSAVDLNMLLPPSGSWTSSTAYSVDTSGNIYGTAVGTYGGSTGYYAVEWSVPEPASGSAVLVFAAGTILRGRRRDRTKETELKDAD
jgi:hypothetical protein